MTETARFQEGDLIDIVLRRAVVRRVNKSGTLAIIHSHEELDHFDPNAAEVEVTVVGREPTCSNCDGIDPESCPVCCGTGRVFR